MTLGEAQPAAAAAATDDGPVFGEPIEFTFGSAGERDEDIDIEEID